MERLCIESFLQHGHDFHLHVYDLPEGLPEEVTILDAQDILPRSAIFKYADRDTYSGFANLFRYKLLLEKGGIWVDMDMVCLAPFCFSQPYVFASQQQGVTNNCMIQAPSGSDIMRHCYHYAAGIDSKKILWGDTGPLLLEAAVNHCGLQQAVADQMMFCPIEYQQYQLFTADNTDYLLRERLSKSHAVHLWNGMWRLNNIDKDGMFAERSLYETLKRMYNQPV